MEPPRLTMLESRLTEQEVSAVQAYVAALQARFGPQLADVLLFGSKARGEAAPGSDVDLVVILDQPNARDLGDARGLGFDIWLSHQVYLSIRAISRQGWQTLAARQSLFYRNVLRDGFSVLPVPA
jgi:predicted nucleotidyltransferase